MRRKQVSVSIFSVAPVVSGDKGIGILTELAPSMKTVLLDQKNDINKFKFKGINRLQYHIIHINLFLTNGDFV